MPKLGHYAIRQEVSQLANGEASHVLVKVPLDRLDAWESTHDAVGRSNVHGIAIETKNDITPEESVA